MHNVNVISNCAYADVTQQDLAAVKKSCTLDSVCIQILNSGITQYEREIQNDNFTKEPKHVVFVHVHVYSISS